MCWSGAALCSARRKQLILMYICRILPLLVYICRSLTPRPHIHTPPQHSHTIPALPPPHHYLSHPPYPSSHPRTHPFSPSLDSRPTPKACDGGSLIALQPIYPSIPMPTPAPIPPTHAFRPTTTYHHINESIQGDPGRWVYDISLGTVSSHPTPHHPAPASCGGLSRPVTLRCSPRLVPESSNNYPG